MKEKLWRLTKTAIKFGVTIFALYWVFTKISFNQVFTLIKSANFILLAVSVILFTASKLIASFRLSDIFKQTDIHISKTENTKLYWLGMFYNLFLPGAIGGDGYKIYLLNKEKKTSVKSGFGAVFTDRLIGVLALAILTVIMFAFMEAIIPYQKYSILLTIILLAGFYVFLLIFYKIYIKIYPTILIYSFGVQILQVFSAYFILLALGINNPDLNYLFLFLLSSVVSILPLTIGGVGAREITFLIGANYLALQTDISIALSLLFYVTTAFVSFFGIIWVIKPLKLK